MPVDTPRAEYTAYIGQWTRCRDCYEGTDSVKEAGEKYLPKLDSMESGGAKYGAYILRALFYNATGRTVEGLSGAIFQKPPVFEVPKDEWEKHLDDVTLAGEPAELFCLKSTRSVLTTGRDGVLVEMSTQEAADQRPYWVSYRAEDIISWRTERIGGDEVLTRVVLKDSQEVEKADDPFETETIEQRRVLELSVGEGETPVYTSTIWSKPKNKSEYEQGEPITPMRRGVALDFIPFVFVSPTSTSVEIEKSPVLDLVDVNLSHYRSMADLEHGRHFTALPTPWVSGAVGDDDNAPLALGSGVAWELSENGKAGMLEFTGQGLSALETADSEKRAMMATLGARLLEEQPKGAETATAVGMRHSGEHATLRTVASAIELAFTQVLKWHCWWVGTEATPDEVDAKMELNKEFFAVKATPEEIKTAMLAWQGGGIAFETFYNRVVEGGWAREGVTAEDELKKIEEEEEVKRENAPDPILVPPPPAAGGQQTNQPPGQTNPPPANPPPGGGQS